MLKNLDQLIDKNLKVIAGYKGHYLFTRNNFKNLRGGILSLKEQIELSKAMQDNGLVVINHGNELIIDVTKKGRKIYESGGWIKHKAEEQKKKLEKKNREAIEEIETQKLINDAKVSKLNAKYRYLPYIISTLSFVIACLAYFRPVEKTDNIQITKDEIIHIADSILTTKKDNSLNDKKIVVDSLSN